MKSRFATKSHRHTGIEESISDLRNKIRSLEARLASITSHIPTITVWSADSEVHIGSSYGDRWHQIVCQYDDKGRCLGGPRPHFKSDWQITEKGFSLSGFHFNDRENESKGWNGQYEAGMRYDEIVGQFGPALKLHSDALVDHIKKEFGLWFPCHIYNDLTGQMYRP